MQISGEKMKQDNLPKDIILLCKKHYNTGTFKTLLEAFNAYYHKYYGCEDVQMDYKFAVNLFLKPTIEYLLTEGRIRSFIHNGLFEESCYEKRPFNSTGCTEFYEVLYRRLTTSICLQKVKELNEDTGKLEWIIDFSHYEEDVDII